MNNGIKAIFSGRLWELDPADYRGVNAYAVKYAQIMTLVFREFLEDQCLLRASALTFSTMLSIVPLFALMFAVLKGFGVQNRLEPLLLEQVAAGSEEIVSKIITYINNTNVTSLGTIGLLALLVSVIMLLSNVEDAFNAIWGVKETRTLYRKFSDYLSVVVSGPVLLLAATSATTTLQSQDLVQWLIEQAYLGDLLLFAFHLVPYVSIWMALTFLYVFIPNTKVHLRSAVVGGIMAGTVWQLAQWGYIHFQVGVVKYNAIYGTLALLPIFMIWIYTSWVVVLVGLEVVYAHQHIRNFRREVRISLMSHETRESLALALLVEIAAAFWRDRPCWDAEGLAEHLQVPERVVLELLGYLVAAGFIAETAGERNGYLPARELEHIMIKEVYDTIRTQGSSCHMHGDLPVGLLVDGLLGRVDACIGSTLKGMSMRDLVTRLGDDESASASVNG